MTSPLLEMAGVSATFALRVGLFGKKAVLKAVDSVSFVIEPGESLGLVGESGCGKSTLGRLACGLLQPAAGQILFKNQPLAPAGAKNGLTGKIQMIFQDPASSLDPRMTVLASIAEPLRSQGLAAAQARQQAEEMLATIGLAGMGRRYPHQFSGGQRQRIAIGRSLITHPDLIICDEPVSALDASVQGQILNLLRDMQERFGPSYLFISHDLAVIGFMCARIMVMYLGQIVEMADRDDLFSHAGHPYTRALLAAMPKGDWNGSHLPPPLPGELPSPINPPAGCYFHPRCPIAQPICEQEAPGWRVLGPRWQARCHFARETATDWPNQGSECAFLPAAFSEEKTIVPQVSAST